MELLFTNKNGQTLNLWRNRNKFKLIGAEGLHGVEVAFSETDSPYTDGATVTNARALPRGIDLTFRIVGAVEENLAYFLSFVKSKQVAKLTKIENGAETEISGLVTVPPFTRLTDAVEVKLQLYCGQPYWEDVAETISIIARQITLLYFPEEGRGFPAEGVAFGVIEGTKSQDLFNGGDTDVGMVIRIIAAGEAKNPRIACSTGTQNGWFMEIGVTMQSGDEIIIDTRKNQKSIKMNGLAYVEGVPLLSLLTFNGEDWLQLEQGSNRFNIVSEPEDAAVEFYITYKRRYEK